MPPPEGGPSAHTRPGSDDEVPGGQSRGLDLKLRPAIVGATSLESADCRHHSDPLHPARGGGKQLLREPSTLIRWISRRADRFEVVRAVDQRSDVPASKNLRLYLITQAERNRIAVTRARGVREPRHNPASLDEATRQHRAHKPLRAGDRDPLHQAVAAVPIRWALAMTLRVMVVAGSEGNTLASTTCTRVNPCGRPSTSTSNGPGCALIGKVPPV